MANFVLTNGHLGSHVLLNYSKTMLKGLQGVLCLMDDVLVYGRDQEDHDKLEAVLQRIQSAGVTLDLDKCEFSKDQLKFLGHIINKDGVRADPAKIFKLF